MIKKEIATILPKEYVVIEILENIEPNDEIADIIKIDFKITTGDERKKVFELKKINNKIKFLAEKVENKEEYDEALKLGYSYFQGYYFSKPIVLSRKNIPTNKDTAIKILKLINKDDFDFNKLEELIIKDLGLSYKIIKLINSSAYCLKNEVRSIKYAIALLGRKEIIKWLYVVLLNDLKENNTDELIKVSLQRAKLCELICNMSEYKNNVYSAYMVGLFSVMDAILNCSIEVILKELYIDDEIKEGLTEKGDFLNKILKLAINYEKGQWENVEFYTKEIGVNDNNLAEAYIDAIKWADDVVS